MSEAAVEELKAFARQVLAPAVYPERIPLEVTARHLPGEPLPPDQAVAGRFHPFELGQRWGGMWGTTWFRCRASVPDAWAGRPVAALVHLGGARTVGFSAEGLIWSPDLTPERGLHHAHREYLIHEAAERPGPVDFYIEAAANPIPRWHAPEWPRLDPDYAGPPLYALEQAELATIDRVVEAFYFDVQVAIQIAESLPGRRDVVLAALQEAVRWATEGERGALSEARAALRPLFEPGPSRRPADHTVTAVGHAHIDSAWLWPVRETKRKCARTFANQLRMMDDYPEHRFACSQAVQYQWVKEGYPDLYERIRCRVADGRWEPVGGMWVEADSNIPSGESLVRQFVHGKRFFLDEFGIETHEMWIPDVFGYSAALPQIATQAGVTALVTQKMSWNDTNVFPHSTFWWEGHDGSRVLAHFPPADTYNGEFAVAELAADQRNFKEAGRSHHTLYPYGYGDGGGGPTRQMLESARRLAAVDGLPEVRIGTVAGFLGQLRVEDADLRTWVGELYLEAHRATSTTHADAKWGNRRGEEALRAAEMWSVAAGLDERAELDGLWKTLLLNQFHDILPGSSIRWVYQDSAADHERILAAAGALIDRSHRTLLDSGPGHTVFNPSSFERHEVVELPNGGLSHVQVPACGWAPVPSPAPGPPRRADQVDSHPGCLDNGILRVTYDGLGLITSIWDHEAEREVIAPGERGNLFQLHEDRPKAFDAWDVDRDYLDRFVDLTDLEAVELRTPDPLRAEVVLVRRFGESRLVQTMRLTSGSRRIEFHTEVDWNERHRFLKVAFPVAVRATRATYEIQHGHIERPTVENTSWDEARFEVSAHRWAHLGEAGYGVALINDCKYGYDVRGHTMRLSLLRGPGYPDPQADQGRHRFAYALLPHLGDLRQGRVVEEAEAFNLPLAIRSGTRAGPGQIVTVDRPGVSVEALKWADDGDGIVLRLCEVHGSRGPVRVSLAKPFASVRRADLLERVTDELTPEGRTVTVHLRPFELVTLRFEPRV
ncbi:MAG: alpha-mannosidase [Acidimicrobiales bacterium]|nr:alpha-mannosidase [Acidimicrobiales bacterium]